MKLSWGNISASVQPQPTFADYVMSVKLLLWRGDHLKRSMQKANMFSAFDNYGSRRMNSFGVDCIHSFFKHLEDNGRNNNTINHYAAMLTKVFRQAAKGKLIKEAPQFTWRIVDENKRPLYYTPAQLAAMEAYFTVDHPAWWMRQLIIIGAETGMRLGEILTIEPSTISFDSSDASYWAHLLHTKNGDERFVPLNERVLQALSDLDNEPMRHHRGNEHLFYRCWADMRVHILQGDPRYVFHTLRHTAATVMANDFGANTAIIGVLLGHKSEKTTAKYIKTKPQALTALVRQFSKRPLLHTIEDKRSVGQ